MTEHQKNRLQSFASLQWYEETIKFIFNFVTKTSELLLAAGIVISTANFLTDGDIMNHNKVLSDAWSWAQALAIDSSLGIVFLNAFQAMREREKIKAIIFFTLTGLLATVAGLITHFDALGHAAGLPVSVVSNVIPLWVMTSLRAVAVIGFLLASRLKEVSFNELRQQYTQEPVPQESQQPLPAPVQEPPTIDYQQLARELAPLLQAVRTTIIEEVRASLTTEPAPAIEAQTSASLSQGAAPDRLESPRQLEDTRATNEQELEPPESATSESQEPEESATQDERLERAYQELRQEGKRISGRALAKRAGIHRTTCTNWLKANHPEENHEGASSLDSRTTEPDQEPDSGSEHQYQNTEPVSREESTTIADETEEAPLEHAEREEAEPPVAEESTTNTPSEPAPPEESVSTLDERDRQNGVQEPIIL